MTSRARAEFLKELRVSCNVTAAARSIGHPRQTLYQIRKNDESFAAEWDDAVDEATDALEAEARRRALDGFDRPVYQRGDLVGYERQYSDHLMLSLLKAHRPERFRERFEHDLGDKAATTFADLMRSARDGSGSGSGR